MQEHLQQDDTIEDADQDLNASQDFDQQKAFDLSDQKQETKKGLQDLMFAIVKKQYLNKGKNVPAFLAQIPGIAEKIDQYHIQEQTTVMENTIDGVGSQETVSSSSETVFSDPSGSNPVSQNESYAIANVAGAKMQSGVWSDGGALGRQESFVAVGEVMDDVLSVLPASWAQWVNTRRQQDVDEMLT